MENQFWLFGIHRTIIADGGHTDLRYDLVEGTSLYGSETPSHIHGQYDELIYILEGELTIYTHKEVMVLRPCEFYFIPMGTPHALSITGNSLTRTLTTFSPAGFAEVISAVGIPGSKDAVPTASVNMELFGKLSNAIGDITLGPPGSRPELEE